MTTRQYAIEPKSAGIKAGATWQMTKFFLDGGDEAGFGVGYAVGHAGSVEGKAGHTVFVEKDEATSAVAAAGEELDGGLGGAGRRGAGGPKKIAGGFGEDDFHDGFAEAGGGDRAGFAIRVAAGTDERRIADAAGKFAARASSGSGGEEAALVIEGDGADGALFVAAMMFGGVGILAATLPGFAFSGRDEFFGIAEWDAVIVGELFGALRDEHHVGTFFEDGAGSLDRIFDAAKTGDGTGLECGGVHDDGVALDVTIEIEMRAVAGVEDGIVFEDGDGSFDGVEGVAAVEKDVVAGVKSAETAGFAGFDGVVGDVPGATVEDERRSHGEKGYHGGDQRPAIRRQEEKRDCGVRA